MINSTNIQWPQAEDHVTGDRGTMALGVKDVDPGVPEVIVATEDFETDPISGSGTWTISLLTPHSGLRCLRSGVIGVSSSTDYTFNIPATATHIRFWWRVSCENNADFFRVYKDAIIPGNLLLQGTGLTDVYAEAVLDVTGATTVTFRYIKDSSISGGLDRAIIDDIEWIIPGIPAIQLYEPFHLNEDNCVKVVLCENEVSVTGEVNTRPLSCETDSITVCIDQVVPVSGTIEIVIPEPLEVAVTGVVDTRQLNCLTDSVEVCQGTDPWNVSGTVALDAPTLAALETITVLQGTSPWVVSGTVTVTAVDLDIRNLSFVTDSVVAVQNLPYVVVYQTGTLSNGAQTAVAAAAVQVAAANANRKAILIQNVGLANVRVGVSGVTTTTGFRLVPGQIVILEMPYVPTQAIFAIREGAISSTVLAQEIT